MQDRKKIFFTSDWHIGHTNVLKLSNRPFDNVYDMHKSFIKRFNSVVPKDGLCYFLGDMGLCQTDLIKEVMSQLNGTKILILGNHDKKSNAMYNMGFECVLYGARLIISGQVVTMSHCPLLGVYRENTEGMKGSDTDENWHGETNPKRRPFTMKDDGQFHLHGHIHSPNGGRSKKIEGRQYDVGVDANKYTPISMSQIESWITKTIRNENDIKQSN